MITIPTLGVFPTNSVEVPSKSNGSRNGSVFELLLGPRDQQSSNRGSREGSMGPPSRQSSNASVSSISSLQEIGSCGSQFFEVLYLGKIKSVSHKKAPPSFIDDVLEIFRAHNQQEQQKTSRQSSLPVPIRPGREQPNFSRSNSKHVAFDDGTPFSVGSYELRPNPSPGNRLVDTKEEEEPSERTSTNIQHPTSTGDTLAILKQTEEVLMTLTNRVEAKESSGVKDYRVEDLEKRDSIDEASQVSYLSTPFRVRTCSGDNATLPPRNGQIGEPRNRASSMGSVSRPKRVVSVPSGFSELQRTQQNGSENNRTMLFQISRSDVKLISPDRKSILLSKPFRDISHCSQGVQHPDNFGFICRDANSDNNVCYVFKCQNSSVADEITAVLKQAAQTAAETQKRVQVNSCEHCPTVWLQRLVADIEGLSEQKAHTVILKRIGSLPENDQEELMAKFQGADLIKTKEQNDLLLMLLRAQCESRQMTHVHDTAENRHEFLNQYLDRGSGAIFQKAKRSLTNSFDQLLKRRNKEEPVNGTVGRDLSLPIGITMDESTPTKQTFRFDMSSGLSHSPLNGPLSPTAPSDQVVSNLMTPVSRPRSSTLCSSYGETIKKELKDIQKRKKCFQEEDEKKKATVAEPPSRCSLKPPTVEKFFKMGHQSHLSPLSVPVESASNQRTPSPRKTGSWRQAIFQQVKTPNQNTTTNDYALKDGYKEERCQVRTSRNYRELWKKAIKQQILLVRMEKENKRLKAHQEEMSIKRMKLNYDEIAVCSRAVARQWDKLLSSGGGSSSSSSSPTAVDFSSLARAIEDGVPKQRRGEVWRFLVKTRNSMDTLQPPWCKHAAYDDYSHLCREPIDYDQFPYVDVPYEELLRELTSHQHLIIIDLGRTFPSHSYYSASLGPGQLALFNLLKAYSLLDSEVGYCQGLSFIGAVLLLHLDEEDAYYMLRYLMLELGLRRQYLPDMAALQVQLYQMARLLRDQHRDLYEHLEQNEVSPSLYAAPWFLTLFASQFPLGFVVRVFDLIFLSGISMIFRVAAALLADHKDMLLQCRNFEQLMDYFKNTLPCMGATQLERVIHEALALDIVRQLAAYEVEYHVLQEEMTPGLASPPSSPHPLGSGTICSDSLQASNKWDRLERSNQLLQKQVRELQNQLQSSKNHCRTLESTLTSHQAMYTRLERQLHDCEADRTALVQLVMDLSKRLSLGEEIVVPPCLVKCFQEFKIRGGGSTTLSTSIASSEDEGISFSVKSSDSTSGCDATPAK